jgi:hypothetical protein
MIQCVQLLQHMGIFWSVDAATLIAESSVP